MSLQMADVEEMLKIDYRDGLHCDINERIPVFSMFEREGEEEAQEADVHRFALKIAPSQNGRTYGTRSPNAFARTDGRMRTRKVDVTYVIDYNPIRISPDVAWRAANGNAAMINTLKEQLKDLRTAELVHKERGICTGYGHDILFELTGAMPVAAPWTYSVTNYAGVTGETLGAILRHLNLRGMFVNVAGPGTSGTPLAYRTLRNGAEALEITDFEAPPPGGETITFPEEMVGAQSGDVVFRSREDANGVQGIADGLVGLAGTIDDYTLMDPFQTINSTDDTASSFVSWTEDASDAALDEVFLMHMCTAVDVHLGGSQEDGTKLRHVFVGNTITINAFAQSLTAILNTAGSEADRGRRVTYQVTREGFKPEYGYARKFLSYNGTPFVDGHLAFRRRLFLVNLDDHVIIHNGPPEGDFLSPLGGGPHVLRIPGSPLSEYVWVWQMQLAARRRNGSALLYGLADQDYI